MFKLNDRVEDKDGTEGTIVYIEDNIVYVELLSGVEMEYTINDIFPLGTYEDKFNKRVEIHIKKQKNITTNTGDNPLLEFPASEILKIFPEMTKVAHEFHNTVNKTLNEPSTWEKASSQQKLNVLASMLSLKTDIFYMALANDKLSVLTELIKDRINLLKTRV